jgi:hypothetical protein
MRKVFSILVVVVLWAIPPNLSAKRVAPAPVSPVVNGNVKYSAQGDGRTGLVVASEVTTGKELWRVEISRIHLKPLLEEDNQWVFINDLKLLDGALLVRDERSRCYRVDLATRHVRKENCP